MTFRPSIATAPNRPDYLRRVAEMRIAPSASGAVNHDSIVYLAKFVLGQVDNFFFVSGAIRCSGATDIQIRAIIEMLARLPEEASDIDSVLHCVTEELGIPVAPHHAFPSGAPNPIATDMPNVEAGQSKQDSKSSVPRIPSLQVKELPVAAAPPPMAGKEPTEQNSGPASILLMAVIGLFGLAVFLGFFVLWAREGWSAAAQKNPVGGAFLFIALGFLYMIAMPLLRDKGYRALSTAMLWLALLAGGAFVSSLFPSCNGEGGEFPLDRPYRK
jgi:hypothetical protein